MKAGEAFQSSVEADKVLAELRTLGSERDRDGMARFGIHTERAYGVSIAKLRPLARRLGRDHALARDLWATRVHEARLLASFVEVPGRVTAPQMERWVAAFDSWDLCDQVCMLFERTPHAQAKAFTWVRDEREFVRRAGFVLMARLAHPRYAVPPATLRSFLREVERGSRDERNFVKKAVNWALREVGKRQPAVRREAVALARMLAGSEDRTARWIGRDALREFEEKGLA